MEHMPVDPTEMERRRDLDYIASLEMVGEGAPDYEVGDNRFAKRRNEEAGYDERELPPAYQ